MFKKLGKLLIAFFSQFGQATKMVGEGIFWVFHSPLEITQTLQQTLKITWKFQMKTNFSTCKC